MTSPSSYGTMEVLTRAAPLALPAAVTGGVLVGARIAEQGMSPLLASVPAATVVLMGLIPARRSSILLLAALVLAGAVAGHRAWSGVATGATGPWSGTAIAMSDAVGRGPGTEVVLEVAGERYRVWEAGAVGRRLGTVLLGDRVEVAGERSALVDRPAWLLARHIVGDFDADAVGAVRPGSPLTRAATRVRRRLEHGARTLGPDDRALFAGLVYGDDRAVERSVVAAFRAGGLSHLTAVSGQNVAFLLAAASPVLVRLGPRTRWAVTLALIGWFAVLTRLEPSVLRASTMAVLSATAFVTGRERSGPGLLGTALAGLFLVDPLLVWSVGLWLSSGATAGLALLTGPLERLLPGPRAIARPLAAALAAQTGVLPVSLIVFGVPPVLSLLANLLAVPVAGAVMLVGLPTALVAASLPDALAAVVQVPATAGVRWVAAIAHVSATLQVPPWLDLMGWVALAVALVARRRSLARR